MAKKTSDIDWKGTPPPSETAHGNFSPYPFKSWDIGDTEAFPIDELQQIRNAVANLNRTKIRRFRYAKVEERGRQRVRVWRVQ